RDVRIVAWSAKPGRQHAPAAMLQCGEAGVRRDAVQPGPHRRPVFELVIRAPGAQVGLLDDVFGVVQRAEHPVAVRDQLSPERFGVPSEFAVHAGVGAGGHCQSLSGVIRTISRCASGSGGGVAPPMNLSYIWYNSVLLGSSVMSTAPRISTYRPTLFLSTTTKLTRGSRAMLRVFSRPLMVLNSTVSPSRLIKITDDCGRPSGFDVARIAMCAPSITSRTLSLRVVMSIQTERWVKRNRCRGQPRRRPGRNRSRPVDRRVARLELRLLIGRAVRR